MSIYLKKYSRGCIFCDNVNNVRYFKGLYICEQCLEDLKKQPQNNSKGSV